MRVWKTLAAACALAIGAGGVALAKDEAAPAVKPITQMSATELEKVRTAGAQILFWSDAQRAANFRAMEAQFPGTTAKHGTPRALPKGEPLAISDADVDAFMAAQNVAGLMVIQDGKVRLEKYGLGMKPDDRWTSFSVAKSFTSTLVGAAVKDGLIASIDDPVTKYVPELKGSGYDGVTVKQILTMTSGVKWNEDYTDPNSDVVKMLSVPVGPGEDPNTAYLKTLPREAEPGTKWVYKTGETNLIGVIVQRATGKTLTEYAQEKIVKPAASRATCSGWSIRPGRMLAAAASRSGSPIMRAWACSRSKAGRGRCPRAGLPRRARNRRRSACRALAMAISGGPIRAAPGAGRAFSARRS